MRSEWRMTPLPDLLSFIVDNRGKTVPTSDYGRKLIATNCVRNDILYPVYEKVRYLSDETYKTWFRSHPIPGDILFVNKGTPGRVCMVPDPVDFCIAQDMIAFRTNKRMYNKFLFAALRSPEIQMQIYNTNVGDVIPHFKKSFLDQLLIPEPDMETQKEIGDIYFSLSNKIELNNKINANLEAQAQSIFKSWFVDFEPFQGSEFVDSELGKIPKGWRVGSIYNLIEVIYGAPFKSSLFNEQGNGYPLIRIRDLKTFAPQFYTSEILPKMEIIKSGDILVGMDAEFRPCIWQGSVGVLNQRVCKIIPIRDSVCRFFVYEVLKPHLEYIEHYKTGTTVSHIGKADIDKIRIIIPPDDVLQSFSNIAEPLFLQLLNHAKQSRTLAAIRDALLPKLMSGEIEVPLAE